MTDVPTNDVEAIRQVINEGGAMDYVDVVDRVREKFGLNVSSALVEQIHLEMRQQHKKQTQPRIKLEVVPSEPSEAGITEDGQSDHLAHALRFVQSVRGMRNAKRALSELEDIMRQLND